MEVELQEAFTEVYEILKITPIELTSRIPTKFRQTIEDNRAKDYKFQLEDSFNEKDLKHETIVILGLIYRDFLADPEERDELKLKDAEELERVERELNEKYDVNKLFKNKQDVSRTEETSLMEYKEQGFLKKLFNLIKGIFKK